MALSIRHMPDFLVQHIESGVLNYVEVKYRANGKFTLHDIEDNPYKSTHFIIISKDKIQTIEFNELEAGKSLPGGELHDLGNSTKFQLDSELVKQYKEYSKTFFEGVK